MNAPATLDALRPAAAPEPRLSAPPEPASTMRPVLIGGCTGWFHPARGTVSDRAVLMCGALGFEALVLHRAWRILADMIAGHGVAVLRIDYPGTGDSAGRDDDPGQAANWLPSLREAAFWLRDITRAGELALCGIQLGGLLAAAAGSELGGVTRLALLAPTVMGRSFIKGQAAMARLSTQSVAPGEAGFLDAPSLRLDAESQAALSALQMTGFDVAPARRILLMDPATSPRSKVLQHWAAQGAHAEQVPFPGYDALMRDAHANELPLEAMRRVASWLAAGAAPGMPAPLPPLAPDLALPCGVERVVRLEAEGRRLVGTLTLPSGPIRLGLVLANTGANPRAGYGRWAVDVARRLAPAGIATLRLDLAGCGDSTMPGPDIRPPLFDIDRRAELRAAANVLEGVGARSLALGGICSGAFHSVRAALADPRVNLVLLLNQDVYTWGTQRIVSAVKAKVRGPRLTTGTSDPEDGPVLDAEIHGHRGVLRLVRRAFVLGSVVAEKVLNRVADPLNGDSWQVRALRTLSKRGTQVVLVAGEGDASLHLLEAHFGPRGRKLSARPGMTVEIIPDLDHSLARYASRLTATELVERHVLETVAGSTP